MPVYFNQDPIVGAGGGGIPAERAFFFSGGAQIPGAAQNTTPMANWPLPVRQPAVLAVADAGDVLPGFNAILNWSVLDAGKEPATVPTTEQRQRRQATDWRPLVTG